MIKEKKCCFSENGYNFLYILKRSSKRKTIEIKIVTDGQIQISVPFYVPENEIKSLLNSKASWIEEKLKEVKSKREKHKSNGFSDGDTILLKGTSVTIRVILSSNPRASINLIDDELVVTIPESSKEIKEDCKPFSESVASNQHPLKGVLMNEGDRLLLTKHMIRNFISENTLKYIRLRRGYFENIVGKSATKITLRDQRHRWGSCSSKGSLNFNFRLFMLPPFVFDYIILHEYCHMLEMNHSKRYWNIIAKHMPDYKLAEAWIKENGSNVINRI